MTDYAFGHEKGKLSPQRPLDNKSLSGMFRDDPVAQTLTKLTAQRDEYRKHMERYQDEVVELKSENAAILKAFRKLALDANQLRSELDFSKALLEQNADHPSIEEVQERQAGDEIDPLQEAIDWIKLQQETVKL